MPPRRTAWGERSVPVRRQKHPPPSRDRGRATPERRSPFPKARPRSGGTRGRTCLRDRRPGRRAAHASPSPTRRRADADRKVMAAPRSRWPRERPASTGGAAEAAIAGENRQNGATTDDKNFATSAPDPNRPTGADGGNEERSESGDKEHGHPPAAKRGLPWTPGSRRSVASVCSVGHPARFRAFGAFRGSQSRLRGMTKLRLARPAVSTTTPAPELLRRKPRSAVRHSPSTRAPHRVVEVARAPTLRHVAARVGTFPPFRRHAGGHP